MRSLRTFLNEDAQGKNLHLEHIEDEILNHGIGGARGSINFIRSLRDMLAGHSRSSINMTVKWDGAPAIFAGIDPSDGKFFVAKKSVFNKTPLLYKTQSDISSDPKLPASLKPKFSIALREFSKLGITNVLQGDLMFTSSDLESDMIDGQRHTTFQPNTIVYAVPQGTPLDVKIKKAKIGVVWHTSYSGRSLPEMQASFGANINNLRKSPSIWMDDATYKDVSGKATFTQTETASITAVLSGVGTTFRKIDSAKLNSFLRYQAGFTGKMLGASVKTYINSKVRQQKDLKRSHASGYSAFVADKYDKEIAKLKTEKSQKALSDKKEAAIKLANEYQELLGNIFEFMSGIVQAKNMIVTKLDSVKGMGTFIRTSNGFKVTNPEGYVAIDRVGGNAVKLVDRMEFSFNNFTAIKAWDR
jgi:hypothetical protein